MNHISTHFIFVDAAVCYMKASECIAGKSHHHIKSIIFIWLLLWLSYLLSSANQVLQSVEHCVLWFQFNQCAYMLIKQQPKHRLHFDTLLKPRWCKNVLNSYLRHSLMSKRRAREGQDLHQISSKPGIRSIRPLYLIKQVSLFPFLFGNLAASWTLIFVMKSQPKSSKSSCTC